MKYEGMIRVIAMSFSVNFLFGIIRVLIIPWFVESPQLGITKYGILSAVQSVGVLTGMFVLSMITLKAYQKYACYQTALFSFIGMIGLAVLCEQFWMILLLFFGAFVFQIVFNMIMNATVMQRTPADKRGKVSAMKTTLGMAISPLGNFVGGLLGEIWKPQIIILISVLLSVGIVRFLVVHPTVREFLNYDAQQQE